MKPRKGPIGEGSGRPGGGWGWGRLTPRPPRRFRELSSGEKEAKR